MTDAHQTEYASDTDRTLARDFMFLASFLAEKTDGEFSDAELHEQYDRVTTLFPEVNPAYQATASAENAVSLRTANRTDFRRRAEVFRQRVEARFGVSESGDFLRSALAGLLGVANSDGSILTAEVALLNDLMEAFGLDESGGTKGSARTSESRTAKTKTSGEALGHPLYMIPPGNTAHIDNRDWLRQWMRPSSHYKGRMGMILVLPEITSALEMPRFSSGNVARICSLIRSERAIPVLSFLPDSVLDYFELKQVWWLHPFVYVAERFVSSMAIDKNGFHTADPEGDGSESRGIFSWESVSALSLKHPVSRNSQAEDDTLLRLRIDIGQSGDEFLSFDESQREGDGHLQIIKAIHEVYSTTIEASRGEPFWKHGAGGEKFVSFDSWQDLLVPERWAGKVRWVGGIQLDVEDDEAVTGAGGSESVQESTTSGESSTVGSSDVAFELDQPEFRIAPSGNDRSRGAGQVERVVSSSDARSPSSVTLPNLSPRAYQFAKPNVAIVEGRLDLVPADRLAEHVVEVAQAEEPVHRSVLIGRIVEGAGLQRAGNRIQTAIETGLRIAVRTGRVTLRADFVWAGEARVVPPRDRSTLSPFEKKIEHIAPEEFEGAILAALQIGGRALRDDVVRKAAESLGYRRISRQISEALHAALDRVQNAPNRPGLLGTTQP